MIKICVRTTQLSSQGLWQCFLEGLSYTVHQIQEEPEYGEEEEEEVEEDEEEEEVDNLDSEVLEEDVLADTFLTMGQQIDILADEVLNL